MLFQMTHKFHLCDCIILLNFVRMRDLQIYNGDSINDRKNEFMPNSKTWWNREQVRLINGNNKNVTRHFTCLKYVNIIIITPISKNSKIKLHTNIDTHKQAL